MSRASNSHSRHSANSVSTSSLPQPFGTQPSGGRTTVRAVAASALFNANTGQHTIESKEPLSPLDVTLEEPGRTLRLVGTTLAISERFESLRAMEEVIAGVFFVLPPLLNIPFADPPYIARGRWESWVKQFSMGTG